MNYESFTVTINHQSAIQLARFGRCLVSEAGIAVTAHEARIDVDRYDGVWASFSQTGAMLPNASLFWVSSLSLSIFWGLRLKATSFVVQFQCRHSLGVYDEEGRYRQSGVAAFRTFHSQSMTVRIGTCVAIKHNNSILLTRRAKTMRTFPRRWVFPGGHVDKGETLEEAAIREVKEEIGLSVCNLSPIGMWESCFPTYLEQGTLSRQHIVFYFAADLTDEYAKDFPAWNHMSPEVEETDCVTWIHMDDLADLLTCKTPDRTADALKISKNEETGVIERRIKKLRFLKFQPPKKEDDLAVDQNEGMSLGTTFILKKAFLKNSAQSSL